MRWWMILGLLAVGGACRDTIPDNKDDGIPIAPVDTDVDTPDPDSIDADRDGWLQQDDCDDGNPLVNPGATEIPYDGLDNDCDPSTPDDDLDGDGYVIATDCNDYDAFIYPGAPEECDGIDNDCDAEIDESGGAPWYHDRDRDGYGDPLAATDACIVGTGLTLDSSDCDDTDPGVRPGAPEICNDIDDDCDGGVDVGALDALTWHPDADGDGFGDPLSVALECDQPLGYVADARDCDDTNPAVKPSALEVCNGIDDNCDGLVDVGAVDAGVVFLDADQDGWGDLLSPTIACAVLPGYSSRPGDCDDSNPTVFPGNPELCDGLDNDCDGAIDEDGDSGTPWYRDADRDGFGDPGVTATGCTAPVGYVADGTDCDDRIPTVYPGAVELCDGFDNDCDGDIDEGATALGTWYADVDGDGFGDASDTVDACAQPPGYAPTALDCDDGDPLVNPLADERCNGYDDDCDTFVDEQSAVDAPLWYLDADQDGFGTALVSVRACQQPFGFEDDSADCDDLRAETYPGAPELCDGLDNDCDGGIDEGAINPATWYADGDGDGFGGSTVVLACVQPAGTAATSGDCDDGNPGIRPGAAEVCDGVDQDCNGLIDDGALNPSRWYADTDGDGFGDAGSTTFACTVPAGFVGDDDDCDDQDADINPDAQEFCDGVDNDCNGAIDEVGALGGSSFYLDVDGDGYGNPFSEVAACTAPPGYIGQGSDCDDGDASINPMGTEVCDGRDNDCNGLVDDGVPGAPVWHRDGDADGFGDPGVTIAACIQPSGYVRDGTDCNDADSRISPARTEVCDGLDNDCDGTVDQGAVDATYWAIDRDGDGFGDPGTLLLSCTRPPGYAGARTDCDDFDRTIRPGAPEFCDGLDQDCDGVADDGAVDAVVFYEDTDGDGWGDVTSTFIGCAPPPGFVAQAGDCDDGNPGAFPGGVEICDAVDNDCDGVVDEQGATGGATYWRDVDADGFGDSSRAVTACALPIGYAAADGDCDDRAPSIYPGATEVCDGLDNDCDGDVDEGATVDGTWYFDGDQDGFGDPTRSLVTCTPPPGYVPGAGDCDDMNPAAYPGAPEYCDGFDNDCDAVTDEVDAVDAETWFLDRDGDAYGDARFTFVSCTAPAGYVPDDTDCNDRRDDVFPGAPELCDGLDNDCNLLIDEGATAGSLWYADVDGDGFGAGTALATCTPPAGYVDNDDDCDDRSSSIRPGGIEVCNGLDDDCDGDVDEGAINPRDWYADADGDTYGTAAVVVQACSPPAGYVGRTGDCNDADAAVRPGAPEVCDSRDNDCDGTVDVGAVDAPTWYADADGDTWGNPLSTRAQCTQPAGFVSRGGDCSDLSATTYPGAPEVCDGRDNDCDGDVDEGAAGATTWYQDADGDRFGNPSVSLSSCTQPAGYVRDATDCDDTRLTVNPARTEVCDGLDNDCDGAVDDGAVDGSLWYADGDGDGVGTGASVRACTQPAGYVASTGDCNDADARIRPGAVEVCDGLDNDCVGGIDVGAVDARTWYRDADGDGFGNPAIFQVSCSQPAGYVANDDDCADNRATVNPSAPEICDGLDNDCNGIVDDGASGAVTWYADADGDGFGDASSSQISCSQPAGHVRDSRDCDDGNPAVKPTAQEICNGIDDDCDSLIDEGSAGARDFFVDRDGDGFGDAGVSVAACSAPPGYVDNDDDCDDDDALVKPGGVEVCNGEDDDCDGVVDDGAVGAVTWWLDADRDGYGGSTTIVACSAPVGYVNNDDDCDDRLSIAYPGAPERCDGIDNDCNGLIDDGSVSTATWYRDADGDGFGSSATTVTTCSPPAGYVLDSRDCNDADAAVFPGAAERCNGVDDNCDGVVDNGAVDATTWYLDTDGDGYGTGTTTRACLMPAGYAGLPGDCNDALASVFPRAVEVCDGVDQDCDGVADDSAVGAPTWYRDADGDGYGNPDFSRVQCTQPAGFVADRTDCLDASAVTFPGAPELCDGLDNDCDGTVDDGASGARSWYRDADGDGFGNPSLSVTSCQQPSGYVLTAGDCDDTRTTVNPAAVEVCDDLDNNCDGQIDNDAVDQQFSYIDTDGDGFGRSTGRQASCRIPAGHVAQGGDCDDRDSSMYPGAPEICDGKDNNCDGTVDGPNPVGAPTWYLDFDRDGHAGTGVTVVACAAPPYYYATATDCNDGLATAYPGAPELCDGVDNNCNGTIDDGAINPTTYYLDRDGDGYGGATGSVQACENPGGYIAVGGDCNDTNPLISPAALEYCDGIDNNCNGRTDEPEAVDALTWYQDADGDRFGNPTRPLRACTQPTGYVGDDTDCNDLFASDNPLGTEVCDGRDNDCDLTTDEPSAVDAPTWYFDQDADTYGVATVSVRQCSRPSGYASRAGDCDDLRDFVNPGRTEVCDGFDNDCNGVTDGAQAVDAATWYRDADGDGYGNPALTTRDCTRPSGYVANPQDCNDGSASVRPTATETCNGIDDDCSGLIDDNGAPCPYPVFHFERSAYMFVTAPLPWTQARDWCVARGYTLVSINSAAENYVVDGLSDSYSDGRWWTGFNDLATEGQWRWASGDAVTYTNWAAGEPNNLWSWTWLQDEDCMQFNRWGDGTWNDEWCSQSFRYICEAD